MPLEELLLRQGREIGRATGSTEEELATEAAIQQGVCGIVRQIKDPAVAARALRQSIHEKMDSLTEKQRAALSDAMIEGQIKEVLSPWFRELLAYDPQPTLAAVKCPVLALIRAFFSVRAGRSFTARSTAEQSGDSRHFFRASRKHIINLAKVRRIEPCFGSGLMVHLEGDHKIEMSRRQGQKFRELRSL